jgi:hypothetical protein
MKKYQEGSCRGVPDYAQVIIWLDVGVVVEVVALALWGMLAMCTTNNTLNRIEYFTTTNILLKYSIYYSHYQNRRLCRVPEALGKALKTLGKMSHSAKRARHTVHRQSLLCRVLFLGHSAKWFAECQRTLDREKQPLRHWVTETASLPSVPGDTRQRSYLCRVPAGEHSTKNPPEGSPCQVLCRVLGMTLGKVCFFVECQNHYTR